MTQILKFTNYCLVAELGSLSIGESFNFLERASDSLSEFKKNKYLLFQVVSVKFINVNINVHLIAGELKSMKKKIFVLSKN